MEREELKNNLQEWLDNATENEIKAGQINFCISPTDLQQIIKALDTTQMVDKSNFDNKQYETDLDCAYGCGYEQGIDDTIGEVRSALQSIQSSTTTVKKTGEFIREDKGFKIRYLAFCCNNCGRLMRYSWLEDNNYAHYCDWCGRKIANMPFKESEKEGMNEENLKDLETIKDRYTYDAQSRQAIEEMAELTQAINKFWRKEMNCGYELSDALFDKNRDHREHIAEEIADVYICLKQMEMFLGISESVENYIDYKIDRQLKRIRESD